MLLQRVAPLWIASASREHLDVIRGMPALRYLAVWPLNYNMDAPDLPPQLQELRVTNVPAQHLQSVQQMPNLRKLVLHCNTPLDVTFTPLPPGHRGLQWLGVGLRPFSTVLSLAKAHAATLQELRILCVSERDSEWHFADLAEGLRQCGLVALRRLVLVREPGLPIKQLTHGKISCKKQKRAVWDALLAADSERVVKVLCQACDECPAYPNLGDFTWRD
ncbi:uncharacterized protein LOC117642297 [Thrips palmi]|uniref:Uncharacterized protein LOC117642297 n=1 Tax=Thrips palmi TaxID=161013 RepID=A0A6P8YI01_THRPL|nr:uncharacterized protein LOC117642297 [Thrips palmi]